MTTRFETVLDAVKVARAHAGITAIAHADAAGMNRSNLHETLRRGTVEVPTLLRILHAAGARLVIETTKGERMVIRATENRKGGQEKRTDGVQAGMVGGEQPDTGEVVGRDSAAGGAGCTGG